MFKVNKNTNTTSMTSFWCFYCYLWTYFTPFSSVSIVKFDQVKIFCDEPVTTCLVCEISPSWNLVIFENFVIALVSLGQFQNFPKYTLSQITIHLLLELFLQKRSIPDVWQGPMYNFDSGVFRALSNI